MRAASHVPCGLFSSRADLSLSRREGFQWAGKGHSREDFSTAAGQAGPGAELLGQGREVRKTGVPDTMLRCQVFLLGTSGSHTAQGRTV